MSFNTFGKIFRFTTWGESHGPAIGCVVDGCPPNIALSEKDIQIDKSEVQLPDGPIKETGDHKIVICVHPEVNVEVLVKVLPE